MKSLSLVLALILSVHAHAHSQGRRHAPPTVSLPPSPERLPPSPERLPPYGGNLPAPNISVFAVLGKNLGPSVDRVFAQKAIDHLNSVVASGCLKQKLLSYTFKTLERDPMPELNKTQAIETYFAGAPYALDLHWYYKRFSKAIGYTYFYRDNVKSKGTETRIWTNTKFISDEKMFASHVAHEISHQLRAGGFGHWSRFDGSFPYVVGNLAAQCLQ